MNLVVMQNRTAVTSSLVVAESFEKRHDNVLRDIEGLLKNEEGKEMFFLSEYEHPQNKQSYKMYYMNRKGFTWLIMGYTGDEARKFQLAYMDAFDEMERQLIELNRPSYEISNPIERAAKWIEEQKEKILLEEKIEEQKPKVLYAEAVMSAENSIEIGTLAKLLNKNGIQVGRNKLFEWLRENKYLKKEGKTKNEPLQEYINKGWFEVVLKPSFKNDGTPINNSKTMVTSKGQKELIGLFLKFNLN